MINNPLVIFFVRYWQQQGFTDEQIHNAIMNELTLDLYERQHELQQYLDQIYNIANDMTNIDLEELSEADLQKDLAKIIDLTLS